MAKFSFTVQVEDKALTVRPHGPLDFHTVGLLKQAIPPLLASEEIGEIRFDYRDVDYTDSSSFGLLLKFSKMVGDVSVENVRPSVKKVFKLAGFDKVFLAD